MRRFRSGSRHFCLKNCTARSCLFAAASEEKVPRFLRFPVFAFFFREYNLNSPDFNLRIMHEKMTDFKARVGRTTPQNISRPDDARQSPTCSAPVRAGTQLSGGHRRFLRDEAARTASSDLLNSGTRDSRS